MKLFFRLCEKCSITDKEQKKHLWEQYGELKVQGWFQRYYSTSWRGCDIFQLASVTMLYDFLDITGVQWVHDMFGEVEDTNRVGGVITNFVSKISPMIIAYSSEINNGRMRVDAYQGLRQLFFKQLANELHYFNKRYVEERYYEKLNQHQRAITA